MKKLLSIMLLAIMLTALLASCGVPVNTNTDTTEKESKSLYELAVEAGFEGTLEEWCDAVANVKKPNITLADAIIIAQTHYFAVYYIGSSNKYYIVDVAEELYKNDTENWYITIAPKDVFDDDTIYGHLGRAHTYVISKETGAIIEIDASGE